MTKDRPLPISDHAGVPLVRGDFSDLSVVAKFGRNEDVGTSFEPVAIGGVYRTPQPASATQLRIKAGDANDDAAGTGARTVYIEGLSNTGALVNDTLTAAGASPSSNSGNSYIRLFRAYVLTSGTYATSAAGSHAANIVIENAAGTEDWLTIDSTNFPKGQSEVAIYSVPLGYRAYIPRIHISVESNKTADVLLFQRQNILEAAAPYTAMREVIRFGAVAGEADIPIEETPLGPFPALTDLGFMAKAASSAQVGVNFPIILEATS